MAWYAIHAAAILTFLVTASQAQIAIDNSTSASGDAATLGFSHIISPGPNPLLLVGVEVHAQTNVLSVQWGTGASACTAACDPATCLCALTRVGTVSDGGKTVTAQLWKLVNPPAGQGNVIVTLPSPHRLVSGATSFFGVDPATPLGMAATSSENNGGPASVSVSSAIGGLVVDAVAVNPNAMLSTTGTGQAQLYQLAAGGATTTSQVTGAGSTAPGAAHVTMSWSFGSTNWAIIAVPIHPGPTPTGPRPPTPSPSPTPTPTPVCAGACAGGSQVNIADIITMASIALGHAPLSECMAGDANHNGQITVDEIVLAVQHALSGC